MKHLLLIHLISFSLLGAYLDYSSEPSKHIDYITLDFASNQCIEDFTVLPDTCRWLAGGAEWYYTPWSIDFQDRLSKIEIIGDTLIENKVCAILGLYQEEEFVEGSELIVFYEGVDGKVYFYENEAFMVLYDFSSSVMPGDTVEYYLPSNFELYDISSSNGLSVPTSQPYRYLYVSEELVELQNGDELRIVHTQAIPVSESENGCFDMGRIINGIGSSAGFLGRGCTQLTYLSVLEFLVGNCVVLSSKGC